MRIAISADTNQGLDSQVAQHFGRCPYFAFVDLEEREVKEVQLVENPFFTAHQPGQVPRFIQARNADVMLSGGMGGRAIQLFQQFGIQTATGASGTIREALERFVGGELRDAAPCAESVAHGHG